MTWFTILTITQVNATATSMSYLNGKLKVSTDQCVQQEYLTAALQLLLLLQTEQLGTDRLQTPSVQHSTQQRSHVTSTAARTAENSKTAKTMHQSSLNINHVSLRKIISRYNYCNYCNKKIRHYNIRTTCWVWDSLHQIDNKTSRHIDIFDM